jgi:hypothetical protein
MSPRLEAEGDGAVSLPVIPVQRYRASFDFAQDEYLV